eukprot:9743119-Karenia_brevis.AAC.1
MNFINKHKKKALKLARNIGIVKSKKRRKLKPKMEFIWKAERAHTSNITFHRERSPETLTLLREWFTEEMILPRE